MLAEVAAGAHRSERYRLSVMAVCAGRPQAAASHHAGVAIHGLPLVDVDLGRIDLVAQVRHPATRTGVRTAPVPDGERVVAVDGVRACSVPACLVQTAAASGLMAGLAAMDAALHRRLVTTGDLAAAATRVSPMRGAGALRAALSLVDGACESPGETRTRLILVGAGLPFRSQVAIADPVGEVVARVDFLVGARVVVEFDGAVKYAGADGRDTLVREKVREDRLRELSYEVVRVTWADLAHPEAVLTRIRQALARVDVGATTGAPRVDADTSTLR